MYTTKLLLHNNNCIICIYFYFCFGFKEKHLELLSKLNINENTPVSLLSSERVPFFTVAYEVTKVNKTTACY